MHLIGRLIGIIAGGSLVLAAATAVAAMSFGSWSAATSAESIPGTSGNLNTTALEGCPFVARAATYSTSRPIGPVGWAGLTSGTRCGTRAVHGATR